MADQGYQTVKFPLATLAVTYGGQSIIRLRDLPFLIGGRIAHLVGFHFEAEVDLTWTTEPTYVGYNFLFKQVELNDGQNVRFLGNGNDLRHFERLENGRIIQADALETTTSTNLAYLTRTLPLGPRRMAGAPTDFAFPCAALENGYLNISWGALTDISADCTAGTGTVYVTAIMVVMDELRIPSFVERRQYSLGGADNPIAGESLWAYASLANSSSYDAFAAGDLASVFIDTGNFLVVQGVNASTLWKVHNAEMGVGPIEAVAGQPRDATYDVSNRMVNPDTPTALQAMPFDQNPILWVNPGGRISKIPSIVPSQGRIKWTGTQTTAGTIAHVTRILPQPETAVARIGAAAANRLGAQGFTGLADPKPLQGGEVGPFLPYMPFVMKRRKAA